MRISLIEVMGKPPYAKQAVIRQIQRLEGVIPEYVSEAAIFV